MSVVLDTNALMMPVECNVRVFEELDRLLGTPDRVTPRAVVDELAKLADGTGEAATAASVGLDLVERVRVQKTTATYADDAVIEVAQAGDVTHVVTNDKPLQQRLRDADVTVISLRGKNKLGITN
ncbi:PIN domain-containing protein [Salinibaculum rarum]|uniref:PIN domain-containing protein n=1 Tax=Salinibaculum rarum TaxID=3058903 RepID=UPI00265E7C3B|nr:twitching motility protein PilT [Salinibaculum sp. KK48]